MKNKSNQTIPYGNNRGITLGGVVALVALIGVLLVSLILVKVRTVEGNQVGVLEDSKGVSDTSLTAGTYVYFCAPFTKIYTYPTSGRVFVMNDKDDSAEPFAQGRRVDALEVNSLDNQKVKFHVAVTWRIDPAHVISLHKNYRDSIEESLIRPIVTNAVGVRATLQNAIDLYSGPKLNELRRIVTEELTDPNGKLAQSGVLVTLFVIEKPKLNPDYEKVIESRQLAIATESQAREQYKANLAIAEAAKAAALKEQFEQVVAAETQKKQAILQQEGVSEKSIIATAAEAKNTIVQQNAESEKIVIAARAEAARNIAISEAQKQAEINRSVGIEAVGKASAEANKLLLASYAVAGSDNYTRIQIAQSLAASFTNVKGYLPQNVTYNTVAENFDKGVSLLVGNGSQTK